SMQQCPPGLPWDCAPEPTGWHNRSPTSRYMRPVLRRSPSPRRTIVTVSDHVALPQFIAGVKKRNPGQDEFVQAIQEVAEDIFDFIEDKSQYHEYQILRRIAEPD